MPPTDPRPLVEPRLLLVSPRRYETAVWRCGQVECEDVIRTVDDVELLAPAPLSRAESIVTRKAQRAARRLLHLDLDFVPQPEPTKLERDYDLLFFYAQNIEDLVALESIAGWRERCAKKVCLIEELWVEDLRLWGDYGLHRLESFDFVGVGFRDSARMLGEMTGLHCAWVPGAIDALRFQPGMRPVARSIDIFGMGRRSALTHRALLELVERQGWTYVFDTVEPRRVLDGQHDQHRIQLAAMIKRSRFFIANRARMGATDVGDQQELGFRSYEGAAAGAVLLGESPKSTSAQLLFDWPDAHVEVPFGATDEMVDVIRTLEADPERVARIRRDNVVNCLRRHDWAYRWQTILRGVDVEPREQLGQRMRLLHELADAHQHMPTTPQLARPA